MAQDKDTAGGIGAYIDIIAAAAIVGTISLMIIPLAPTVLDLLQVLNLTVAITIMLVSIYVQEPLEFSIFPSLLLITTLFRLGLNISATRLILLQGHAGSVIDAFGNFVVGGNYVVGVVVFLILTVIQFIVITNGAGRVAEVAARFTLDAMPGKQLSIDADLQAGTINEQEARRRRQNIQKEADFYGAMDGASKFVKGDAIAGLVIIAINIIGGFVIGVLQLKMDLTSALSTFTLLTVGDGLVTQIPALIISTATGIIVTRAASQSNLGREIAEQILANPRALAVVSALLFAFGLVPGMPKLPFFAIGALAGVAAYMMSQVKKRRQIQKAQQATAVKPEQSTSDTLTNLLDVDPLEVELGYGLISLVDKGSASNLLTRITLIRRQVAQELGVVLPTIRVRDNLQLKPNGYRIKLRGVAVARGDLMVNHYLAMSSGLTDGPIEGVATTEPAFGLPATWISAENKEKAEVLGYTTVDAQTVLATHLTEVAKNNAWTLLGKQDVQNLISNVKAKHPAVVEDLIPAQLTISDVQQVLQNLLRERVSIRDLEAILEALSGSVRTTKDPDQLSEKVRRALARSICTQLRDNNNEMQVITLAPELEQVIAAGVERTEQGMVVALNPTIIQPLLQRLAEAMEHLAAKAQGQPPVLICSPRVRLPIRRLVERNLPALTVLAYDEIDSQTQVQITERVELPATVAA